MDGKVLIALTLLLVLLAIAVNDGKAEKSEYTVTAKFLLDNSDNAGDTLQLLLDRRLTESVRTELWGKGNWSFVFSPESPIYKEFSTHPPANSKLSIWDNKGQEITNRVLDTPLAKLELLNPTSKVNQFYLLSEDYTAGMGSYNGLRTTLLQVSYASIQDVKALNVESHQDEKIRLVKSLKSDWRRESSFEILTVSCRPKADGNFVIDFARYHFDGIKWREYKRETDGFWESDEAFPERSAFP